MSKAFTKEDSNDDLTADADLDIEESEDEKKVTRSGKNYITPKGHLRLKNELHELLTIERPRLVETVAWAASNGDRSENADYIYGKRRLREIDRRIRFLQKRLDASEVVDPSKQSGNKVLFGATVDLLYEDGKEMRYSIVGIDEADAKAGKISWISPLAQALLQNSAGDAVVFRSPQREEEIEIKNVMFIEIP